MFAATNHLEKDLPTNKTSEKENKRINNLKNPMQQTVSTTQRFNNNSNNNKAMRIPEQ